MLIMRYNSTPFPYFSWIGSNLNIWVNDKVNSMLRLFLYRSKFKKLLNISSSGFTLPSLMTGLGIGSLSMAILGIGFKITNESMEKIHIHSTLVSVSQDLRHFIMDDKSWNYTIRDINNISMQCLREGEDCTSQINPEPFIIKTNTDQQYYNGILPNSGFTTKGEACTTYQTSGNSNCPIRVNITWNAFCSPMECVHPDVFVSVNFIYNPDPEHKRNNVVNTSIYDFNFLRKDKSMHEDLLAIYTNPPALQTGEANCTPGSWKERRINQIVFDKGSNISLANNTTTNTQFYLAPGTYSCTIKGQAYDTGESRLRLFSVTDSTVLSEGPSYFAEESSSVEVELNVNFSFNEQKLLEVQQYCERSSGGGNLFDFGVPTMVPYDYYADGQSQIFSSVECVRTK